MVASTLPSPSVWSTPEEPGASCAASGDVACHSSSSSEGFHCLMVVPAWRAAAFLTARTICWANGQVSEVPSSAVLTCASWSSGTFRDKTGLVFSPPALPALLLTPSPKALLNSVPARCLEAREGLRVQISWPSSRKFYLNSTFPVLRTQRIFLQLCPAHSPGPEQGKLRLLA